MPTQAAETATVPRLLFYLEEHLGLFLPPNDRAWLEHTLDKTTPLQPQEFSTPAIPNHRIPVITPESTYHIYAGRLLNNNRRSHQRIPSAGDILASVYEFFHGTTMPYINRILRNPELLALMEATHVVTPLSLLGRITTYSTKNDLTYIERKPFLVIPETENTTLVHAWEKSWANHWVMTPKTPTSKRRSTQRLTRQEYEDRLA